PAGVHRGAGRPCRPGSVAAPPRLFSGVATPRPANESMPAMNSQYRRNLPGTTLDYFDTRAAVDALQPGAYATLPYTSRVLVENLVRRCDPATLDASLRQLIERRRDLDFPWYPARVVCHDILGQTALVDLAGLRDAIADK